MRTLLVAALACIACSTDRPPPPPPPPPQKAEPPKVTRQVTKLEELNAQYAANAVAADERYKGKPLTVGGLVRAVGKSDDGIPVVELLAGSVTGRFELATSATGAGSLEAGQNVTLDCDGAGYDTGTAQFRNCTIAPK
ncbi:MAG TPA: hypothetical protein VIU61_09810 [Kofleriaceae bacterium]